MKNEARLRKELSAIQQQLDEIESKRLKKKNAPLLGRCFKFRSRHGVRCPGWWVYAKVTSVDPVCRALTFGLNTTLEFSIQIEGGFRHSEFWVEIPAKEFDDAWKSMIEMIGMINIKSPI
jgi:hypothetical protein